MITMAMALAQVVRVQQSVVSRSKRLPDSCVAAIAVLGGQFEARVRRQQVQRWGRPSWMPAFTKWYHAALCGSACSCIGGRARQLSALSRELCIPGGASGTAAAAQHVSSERTREGHLRSILSTRAS